MYFTYNGNTIGAIERGNTQCINKPKFSGDRSQINVTIDFILYATTDANWWTAYKAYLDTNSGLLAQSKKLEIFFNTTVSIKFDPTDASSIYGIPVAVNLDIIGDSGDIKNQRTLRITFTINMTSVVANGAKNVSWTIQVSSIGQKVCNITADFPRTTSGNDPITSYKSNMAGLATAVLSMVGGINIYQFLGSQINAGNPNMAAGTKPDVITVQNTYQQLFLNQESGQLVSPSLREVMISMAPEKFIDFNLATGTATEDAVVKNRIRVEYSCKVFIEAETVSGSNELYDLAVGNVALPETFLSDIFETLCLPRIEEIVQAQTAGTITMLDLDLRLNPYTASISAVVVYDNLDGNILAYEERLNVKVKHKSAYKYTDGEDDTHYIDKHGKTTIYTITVAMEYFRPGGVRLVSYVPSGVDLLDSDWTIEKGQPRIRSIKNGWPVNETTAMSTFSYVMIKNKEDSAAAYTGADFLTGDPFTDAMGIDSDFSFDFKPSTS